MAGTLLLLGSGGAGAAVNPLLVGLEAYWGFDNALTDSSGNGRTLTDGGVGYIASASFKKLGAAALQPLAGDATRTWGGSFDLLTSDVSLTAWLSSNASGADQGTQGWGTIFSFGGASGTNTVAKIGGVAVYSGSGDYPFRTPIFVVLTWDHLTGTWAFYVNGTQVGTGSGVTPATHALTGTFNAMGGGSFNSDDCSVYSRVLTGAEVTTLYNGGAGLNPTA